MSPVLKLALVYVVCMAFLLLMCAILIKVDPQHDELAKEEYKKRLEDELRKLG